MLNAWQSLLLVWGLSAVAMTLGWVWQRRRDNAGCCWASWAMVRC
ncbi:hypothetical protein [Aquabacterium soli]|nr:hypothetical protein [Aquabacterium soli]